MSGGANPTGLILFRLYGPNDTTCTGAVIFTSTITVNGSGTYVSGFFTPIVIGTYRWIANYSGDGNNIATTNTCNAANESSLVTIPTIVTTVPTLSEAALMLLAMLMGASGLLMMRRSTKHRRGARS